jgi:hypothetical protein
LSDRKISCPIKKDPGGAHGQNEEPTSKNCPIERLSRTKWRLNQVKLSNREALMDKMRRQSAKTVQ